MAGISPWDAREASDRQKTLDWIDAGTELFRRAKPATPPMHLVSYFPVIDGDHILLGDHITSGLWLPNGGHVDPGENPVETVKREMLEELNAEAVFLETAPLFITVQQTTTKTGVHWDVSLWFAVIGDRHADLQFDTREFTGIRWFPFDGIPVAQTDPNLPRYLSKLSNSLRR